MEVRTATQGYKVNGLTFPSKEDFYKLKHTDEIFHELINLGKDYNKRSKIEPSDYFNNLPKVKVIETYPDACEELEGLFVNAAECLMFEDEETSCYHIKLYKVADKFFERIEIDVA